MKALATLAAAASLLALAGIPAAAQTAPGKAVKGKATRAQVTETQVSAKTAKATLRNAEGKEVGSAALTQTPAGVLIRLTLEGVPPGERAVHIHGVGKCEPPFASAGPHFNPRGRKHGLMAAGGHHAGDMPNLVVPPDGTLTVEVLNPDVTLAKGKANSLFAGQGSALVIHAGKDDYKTDPAGDAGGRIACGVISRAD
jgi:Cu-Zn family superoxide dismutase